MSIGEEEIRLDSEISAVPLRTLFEFSSVFCCQLSKTPVYPPCHRPQTMASLPLFSPAELSQLDSERNSTHYHSAWGTDSPVEYSPSGSTTELVDLQPSRQSSDITTLKIMADIQTAWHPKLTMYRLLVILSTVGPGVAKEVTSYLNLTYDSITLEWILGVVLFLV